MGIPKFFHFISERWPQISQLIDGTQIPEFDNLYLDMNSILHNCTHGDSSALNSKLAFGGRSIFEDFQLYRPSFPNDQAQRNVLHGNRWCCATSQDEPTEIT